MTEEQYIENTVQCIERLRAQYPDGAYAKTVREVCDELLKDYDKLIAKKRAYYNALTSFKEKKKYYEEVLSLREYGYQEARKTILSYNGTPRPYETWVTPPVYDHMKDRGYKNTIAFYIHDIIK